MKNILITGGAGFIGSRLCVRLFGLGYNVTVMDNLSTQIHGSGESSLFKKIKNKCTFIKGDVRNKDDWKKAIENQQIVIHFAAETGTAQSMYEEKKYNDVNVAGTRHLIDILLNTKHNVNKILIASSRSIYGEGKYLCANHGESYPVKRNDTDLQRANFNPRCSICSAELQLVGTDEKSKIHPSSIYGITKYKQEEMILDIGKSLKIPVVSLRYQNVFGPGQSLLNPYTGILSIFSTRILNGNDLDIYEDGNESRDFVYIEDAVDATILCLEKDAANGEVFNIGSGVPTSVMQVALSLKRLYNSNVNISVSGRYRKGDIRHNYADLAKIKHILGFIPKYTFNQGIIEFVKWVKKQDIMEDKYESSINELKKRGLIK